MMFVLGIAVGISAVCGCDDIIKKLSKKTDKRSQENDR